MGKTYYHNSRTGETTWNRPALAVGFGSSSHGSGSSSQAKSDTGGSLDASRLLATSTGVASRPTNTMSLNSEDVRGPAELQKVAAAAVVVAAAAKPSQKQASESASGKSTETWVSSTATAMQQQPGKQLGGIKIITSGVAVPKVL